MKGFTLLEGLITIIILGIITGTILGNYNDFAAALSLRRNAQQIALTIREAQASAFAVRGFDHDRNTSTAPVFNSWGIHFDKTVPGSYSIFVDLDGDKLYDAPSPGLAGELVQTVKISNNVTISELCKGLRSSEPDNCDLDRMTIVYQRPNPDTTLKAWDDAAGTFYQNVPDFEIRIKSPDGNERTVAVWLSGQISGR
ncbi:hypothetical protein A3B18_00540 [Candidatus Giovannonibacteria bacterium RIFCSPLOWO2_01_FULL_46_13]|uniref:General secretion pathway GspH domain-containing protein n=1 Tax=Candidatus Giovannonibacteria bacterium RIFCSPLOWO2_01_FULL_46_13 TaxID=1798352 RepID=A0A1F5X5G9_9BACT|nr:MAG: hypothetical protein A3B18_00540 [Candidatus Giovannonibacteria bacterium RIFCSPLOWO2_01_FULL_46_13]